MVVKTKKYLKSKKTKRSRKTMKGGVKYGVPGPDMSHKFQTSNVNKKRGIKFSPKSMFFNPLIKISKYLEQRRTSKKIAAAEARANYKAAKAAKAAQAERYM